MHINDLLLDHCECTHKAVLAGGLGNLLQLERSSPAPRTAYRSSTHSLCPILTAAEMLQGFALHATKAHSHSWRPHRDLPPSSRRPSTISWVANSTVWTRWVTPSLRVVKTAIPCGDHNQLQSAGFNNKGIRGRDNATHKMNINKLTVSHCRSVALMLALLFAAGYAGAVEPARPTKLAKVVLLSQAPGEGDRTVTMERTFCGAAMNSPTYPQVMSVADLDALTLAYLGQDITTELMTSIIRSVTDRLNREGRYLTDVYFPPDANKDIRSGTMVLMVQPALLGRVIAKGQQHYAASELECRIHLRAHAPIDLLQLATDIKHLNAGSSWRHTDTVPNFEPGVALGSTDVILQTIDEAPLRVYASVENTGTRSTDMDRVRTGFDLGNAFGRFDHQLSYSHISSYVPSHFSGDTLDYTVPLDRGDRLAAHLEYTNVDVNLVSGLFHSTGSNLVSSIEWTHALEAANHEREAPNQEVHAGFEYKRVGSNLSFDDTTISNVTPQILQGFAGWRTTWVSPRGASLFHSKLTLSPGGLLIDNDDKTFNASREGARPAYWRLNATFEHTNLPATGWQVSKRINAQLSSGRLISSERFGMTGVGAVRGFYQDTLVADAGIVGTLELQTPHYGFNTGATTGDWQFIAFVDAGRSWNTTEEYNSDFDARGQNFNLASTGFGVRVKAGRHLTLRMDLAQRRSGMRGDPEWLSHGFIQLAF